MSAREDAPAGDRPIASGVGVMLVNLGTPDAPEPEAVRRYLAEFLSDKRVVELPSVIWQPILRTAVLTRRPKHSAHAYRKVWRKEEGSPLAYFTRAQAAKLQARLGIGVLVKSAMRYGNPAIEDVLGEMTAQGCERILMAPLYPQYCAATSATAADALFRVLLARRVQPAVRVLPPYYADPSYIGALVESARAGLAALDFEPDLILASFHGMPERTRKLGDPYADQCLETARLLSLALGREVAISFQSRFGRAKWLEPATDARLMALPREGVKRIAVIAPGFASDCLETLEEIAIRGREQFAEAGGEHFAYIPCLNDGDAGMAMLENLVRRELSGWI